MYSNTKDAMTVRDEMEDVAHETFIQTLIVEQHKVKILAEAKRRKAKREKDRS